MKAAIRGLAAAACVLLCAAAAPGSFVDLFNAATRAHDAKDYAAMEASLRKALELRPAHPAAVYELAAALALRGERRDSLEALEALARMGLSYAPREDPDFQVFANSERFADVAKELERNARPAGRATELFRVFMPTFIPEGLAYDEDSHAFFIGGVHERRIQRVLRDGEARDFVGPGAGALWAPMGMVADSRRRLLWVATAAIPEMMNADPAELGRSAVIAYDLATGVQKRRMVLDDGKPGHLLNDITLARNGMLYATDSATGVLYEVDGSKGTFTALTQPGQLASPQGVVQWSDRDVLFVADRTQGLFRYDLDDRKLTRMDVARDICVYGIDGLYRFDDDLIAVQNGIRPHRVVRFRLSRSGHRVEFARVLVSALPQFDEPTLGVVSGRRFNFVANSQWDRFDEKHQLPPKEQLKSPVVMRVPLDDDRRRDEESRDPFRDEAPQASPSQGPLLPPLPIPR